MRGHKPRSSELITPPISLLDPGREERREEGEVGGSSWPGGGHREKKADYLAPALTFGGNRAGTCVRFRPVFVCIWECLCTLMSERRL